MAEGYNDEVTFLKATVAHSAMKAPSFARESRKQWLELERTLFKGRRDSFPSVCDSGALYPRAQGADRARLESESSTRLGQKPFNTFSTTSATAMSHQAPSASTSSQRSEGFSHSNEASLQQSPRVIMPSASTALRPHSTPATMKWLEENYQQADGVCIARHVIYNHYRRFCQINSMSPTTASIFGKIIRLKFSMVKNRRLGMRGCTTYHYLGIGILTTSSFNNERLFNASNKGSSTEIGQSLLVQPSRQQVQDIPASFTPRCNTLENLGVILFPQEISSEMANSFVASYQDHCRRVYESIFRMNLQEVQELVPHFWNGVSGHLIDILGTYVVVNIVGFCDSSLYESISNVLLPNIHRTASPELNDLLKKLASNYENWLSDALLVMPAELRMLKLALARNFCRGLSRLTSLSKFYASKQLAGDPRLMMQMLVDLRNIDISEICSDWVHSRSNLKDADDKQTMMTQFEQLVELQASKEQQLKWLDTVVERCVVQVAKQLSIPCIRVARNFLLVWVGIETRILRELTLTSAKSFGSFHLLGLIFNDYLTHSVEMLIARAQAEEMKKNIALNLPTTLDRGFFQYQREESNMLQVMPANSQPSEPSVNQSKIATSSYEQLGPAQGSSLKQGTDVINGSNTKQDSEETHMLFDLENQIIIDAGPLEDYVASEVVIYTSSSDSPNHDLQMYAT